MNLIDVLNQIWTQILDVLSIFVMPDWDFLVKVAFVEGPRVAEIGPGGDPVFPVGLPHCRRHALVYPSGTLRCDLDGDPLTVVCPMCGLGRLPAGRS